MTNEPALSQEVLRELDLGNSVAEHDDALERYFVETEAFRRLVRGTVDIVAGDKGTGKTALYRILVRRARALDELRDIEIVTAFNPVGNSVFQRLAEGDVLAEGQYASIWKAYILSLVGNWVLAIYQDDLSEEMRRLQQLLARLDLLSGDESPNAVFSGVVNLVRRITNPRSAEVAISFGPQGMPVLVPKIEFQDPGPPPSDPLVISHEEAFDTLTAVLDAENLTIWVVFDRLDEAFQGFPTAEVPALRALFRTYLDLQAFGRVRLKLFVRRDLFRRVMSGGFVNLTHVNARRFDITWTDEDLYDLLFRRFSDSASFIEMLGVPGDADAIFDAVFPEKVDPGNRKPRTWPWILSRVRDGNGIKPPRNLIDLVKKAQEAQLRQEERAATRYEPGNLIRSDSLKRGLAALSKDRVEDTLLAEAGDYAALIERFRRGKTEHNDESLATQLRLPPDEARDAAEVLRELGFLEQVGDNYKIPMLYRDGLELTQGKAFTATGDEDADDDET